VSILKSDLTVRTVDDLLDEFKVHGQGPLVLEIRDQPILGPLAGARLFTVLARVRDVHKALEIVVDPAMPRTSFSEDIAGILLASTATRITDGHGTDLTADVSELLRTQAERENGVLGSGTQFVLPVVDNPVGALRKIHGYPSLNRIENRTFLVAFEHLLERHFPSIPVHSG
jgi:hypothetical protein